MDWKSLFAPGQNMSTDEVRRYLAEHRVGDYQLLDVRQPKEYEAGHIAGARLIPVRELVERIDELDPERPVIAYCAVGGRSKAAVQFLAGKGFKEVYNMSGGINAWNGRKVLGVEEAGLELLIGVGEFRDAVHLAFSMEDGLQKFYQRLLADGRDKVQGKLLAQLVNFEARHKARLLAEYRAGATEGADLEHFSDPSGKTGSVMEGGVDIDEFFVKVSPQLNTAADILELAMMLETQACDLYLRMARKCDDEPMRRLFLTLADEETMHLGYLARDLDRIL